MKQPKYEWKTIRTTEANLNTTLNEIEEKTNWKIFNVFSHKKEDNHIIIVLRKRKKVYVQNPEQYVGASIYINRLGKLVEANLYQVNDKHFKAVWVGPEGKPQTGIVPFQEAEKLLKPKAAKNSKVEDPQT